MRHGGLGQEGLVDFNAAKLNLFHLTGGIDVKTDGSVLDENSSFKMLWSTFSSKLDWGSYIISIAKTASKKIGALIPSVKFLSPEIALYLKKSMSCLGWCSWLLLGIVR